MCNCHAAMRAPRMPSMCLLHHSNACTPHGSMHGSCMHTPAHLVFWPRVLVFPVCWVCLLAAQVEKRDEQHARDDDPDDDRLAPVALDEGLQPRRFLRLLCRRAHLVHVRVHPERRAVSSVRNALTHGGYARMNIDMTGCHQHKTEKKTHPPHPDGQAQEVFWERGGQVEASRSGERRPWSCAWRGLAWNRPRGSTRGAHQRTGAWRSGDVWAEGRGARWAHAHTHGAHAHTHE